MVIKREKIEYKNIKTATQHNSQIKSHSEEVCFGQCFESGGVGAVSGVLWKGVPEGGGSDGEGSVPPGSELGSCGDREEVRF